METTEKTQFLDKVVKALRNAAVEVEEFQVKANSGKLEAQETYEEVKKKFNQFIENSEVKFKAGKEKLDDIYIKFEELRVQLALGKAESIEVFKEQKKRLLLTLHEIEVKIKSNERLNRMYAFVLIEIEKFKVQLEVFEKKYDESKKGAKVYFEKGKQEFDQFIEGLKDKYAHKKEETKWEHLQSEVSEAFDHLKNAFSAS
jgi:hypothetical protein